MNQEIAISPTFISALGVKCERESGIHHIFAKIETDIIVIDSHDILRSEWGKVFENCPPGVKEFFPGMFIYLATKRIKSIDVIVKRRSEEKYALLENEFIIANRDECRVILAENISENVKIKGKMCDIEIADIQSYTNPPVGSKIKSNNDEFPPIDCKKGEIINEYKVLKRYFQNSKNILIEDAYAGEELESNHIERIIKILCRDATSIIIRSRYPSKRKDIQDSDERIIEWEKRTKIFIERLERLKNLYKGRLDYSIVENRFEMADRKIDTDKYTMSIGHYLGSVDEKGKIENNSESL